MIMVKYIDKHLTGYYYWVWERRNGERMGKIRQNKKRCL